ncbi:signal peptide peptidase SppA [bacterium]|nr:signal peptide peptidase SppA [bacterium]
MKNKACCWILAILGIVFILFILLIGVLFSAVSGLGEFTGGKTTPLEEESFLIIRMSGVLPDYDAAPNLGSLTSGRPLSIHSINRALQHAKDDPMIRGVVLRPVGMGGFASIREIREAIRGFKESGKPVYAFAEIASDRDYYLASIADSIFMSSTLSGGLFMEGLGISSTYLAKTFDKLGIKFHVFHMGEYKGAFESWGSDRMSEPLRESLQSMIDDLYDVYIHETAADRTALTFKALEQEMLNGERFMISPQDALQKGFIDDLLDWQDFKDRIMGDDEKDFAGVTVSHYLRTFKDKPGNKKKIAVVYAQGEINYSYGEGEDPFAMDETIKSAEFAQLLREIRDDEEVAAVVLRVNSPGGSALGSKVILEEALRLKEAKPLVVSMGRIAASGGYFISCGANSVMAQPNTITGSIGVVAVLPNLEGLYNKIEALEEVVKKGKWAQFFRIDQELTKEQETILNSLLEDVYAEFKDDVASGRGMTVEAVQEIARGRVWTGRQAHANGLVDQMGGLNDAIEKARTLAELDSQEVYIQYYPKKQEIIDYVIEQLFTGVKLWQQTWLMTPETLLARRAIDYLQKFGDAREYVQAILPVQTIE